MSNNLRIRTDELYSVKTGNTPRRRGRAADPDMVAMSPGVFHRAISEWNRLSG